MEDYTIVFYAPTIEANAFFAELIASICAEAAERGFQLRIRVGESFDKSMNYTSVIRDVARSENAEKTAIIMIPPSPRAYDDIWRLKRVDVPLITLDVNILPEQRESYRQCEFHKMVIVSDNEAGSKKAADHLVKFCEDKQLTEINVIVCEGDMHSRGKTFLTELRELSRSLDVEELGTIDPRPFGRGVENANEYLSDVLAKSAGALQERPTFVFCANELMTFGARMALSTFQLNPERDAKDVRIICYDASPIIQKFLNINDQFIWRAVDQQVSLLMRRAVDVAEDVLRGDFEASEKGIDAVEPDIVTSLGK